MSLFTTSAITKRNIFFSFHYADIMRVNNVRKSGEFKTEATNGSRNIEGFYDYSLWESRKLAGENSLKDLIREGVERTSAICVLVGTDTWRRPWVRYEIARSVIDGRGLLAVHINGLKHHQELQSHALGENPCRYLGIAKKSTDGKYYLCERVSENQDYTWKWYQKHKLSVNVPAYMPKPTLNNPVRLSDYTQTYDWTQGGHNRIGAWIDAAAQAVRR